MRVIKADEVVLLIAAGTDYQGYAGRRTKDPELATLNDLNLAAKKPYASLRKAALADYQLRETADDVMVYARTSQEGR